LKLTWALLVIGKLGKSAQISLHSIFTTEPQRVCILADLAGEAWVRSVIGFQYNEYVCFHQISNETLSRAGCDVGEFSKYVNFGKSEFVKLTALKWLIILESLKSHEDSMGTLFSDLDVFYFRSPQASISRLPDSNIVSLQDDSRPNSTRPYFCTGVMYWKKGQLSENALLNLFEQQVTSNSLGKLIPDETMFNRNYFKFMPTDVVRTLNPNSFVIGHKFFHLAHRFHKVNSEMVCFHANYVIGQRRKYFRLRTVELRYRKKKVWVVFYLIVLLDWAKVKILSEIKSLKSKIMKERNS